MKQSIVVGCGVMLCACMPNAPKESGDALRRADTARNAPVVLENLAFWNKDCSARRFQIDVTTPPTHGQISNRDATRLIPANPSLGTASTCTGTEVASKEILYTPNAGFSGKDTFTFRVSGKGGTKSFPYEVSVQ